WVVAPYIAALTVARVAEPRPGLRQGLRTVVVAAATAAIVVGIAVGLGRPHVFGAASADTVKLVTVAAWGLAPGRASTLASAVRSRRGGLVRRLALGSTAAVHAPPRRPLR